MKKGKCSQCKDYMHDKKVRTSWAMMRGLWGMQWLIFKQRTTSGRGLVEGGQVGIAWGLFSTDMSQWLDESCWSSERFDKFWLIVFGWGVYLQGGIWDDKVITQHKGRSKKQYSPGAIAEEEYLVELTKLTNRKWRLAALRPHTSWPSFETSQDPPHPFERRQSWDQWHPSWSLSFICQFQCARSFFLWMCRS
jgi:hypothetical protein